MIYPLESDLGPVIFRDGFERIGRDGVWQRDEFIRCSEEPWYWLVNYIWTVRRDEHVSTSSIERFPADAYLRYIYDACFREPFLVIDKSRQMRMTWLLMSYYLWHVQFHSYELGTLQTKKERDADDELVERAYIMWRNQAPWLRAKAKRTYCRLVFPDNGSVLIGIPSGGDQIRSHNPSLHFMDECGFLEGEFDECKDASLACCKDVKMVSSANSGQWCDFVTDNTENFCWEQ